MYLKWGKTKRKNQIGIIALRHHRTLNLFASNLKLLLKLRKKEKEAKIKIKYKSVYLSRTDQSEKNPTGFKANNTITKKPYLPNIHRGKNRQML